MGMNREAIRSLLLRFSMASVIVVAGIYAAFVHSTIRSSPEHLISCMELNVRWSAWTCEQVLRYAPFADDHLHDLNRSAGARFPLSIRDARKAEEILALFLSKGVDINAHDERLKGWTALHGAAISHQSKDVALLLKVGAKVNVRDADGRTPLDLARLVQEKRPDNSQIAEIIRLLEAAQFTSKS